MARSVHEQGINADTINLGVWQALSTRGGGELFPAKY